MDDDIWYFQVGGILGVLPAIIAFVGGWWYCADTYGFLLGFGLGWFPSLILAALVELAFILLWGPALAAVAYFVVLPAIKHDDASQQTASIAATSSDQKDYSKMTDRELLQEIVSGCGEADPSRMTIQKLRETAADCAETEANESVAEALVER